MSKKLFISVLRTDVCEIRRLYYVPFAISEFHILMYLLQTKHVRCL